MQNVPYDAPGGIPTISETDKPDDELSKAPTKGTIVPNKALWSQWTKVNAISGTKECGLDVEYCTEVYQAWGHHGRCVSWDVLRGQGFFASASP